MTEQEMAGLIREADAIDQGEAAHAEAAADGRIDPSGNILEEDPDAAAREWFLIPKMLAFVITGLFPETAPAYTDEKCMELAHAIAPVADKYGLSGIGDCPELTLLMGTGFFCLPGVMAYKQRQALKAAQAKEAQQGTAAEAVRAASAGGAS